MSPTYHLQPHSPVAGTGNTQVAWAGGGQAASRGRKGPVVPVTGCTVRPLPQQPGTSWGRARFSGELLLLGHIELPLRVWSPSPPTSHWEVLGQAFKWVAVSPTFPGKGSGSYSSKLG